MTCILQICFMIASIYWIEMAQSIPIFQGFSVQKGFEVNFKPFQFKPISLFKEKWSPFGRFGIRKGIQKRDLGDMTGERTSSRAAVVPPAPVFEFIDEGNRIEERKENTETSATELRPGPDPLKPISSNLIRIPLTESFKPPTEGRFTNIDHDPPAIVPPKPVIEQLYGELPPRPIGPVPEPTVPLPQQIPLQPAGSVPIRPVSPIPLQTIGSAPLQSISPIPVQHIGSFPVNPIPLRPVGLTPGPAQPPAPQVIPLITPPPPSPVNVGSNVPLAEIPPTDGPLVRGSRVALYYGNILLQLVSQFLTNARLQFSQLSKQTPLPPIPPPPVPINN